MHVGSCQLRGVTVGLPKTPLLVRTAHWPAHLDARIQCRAPRSEGHRHRVLGSHWGWRDPEDGGAGLAEPEGKAWRGVARLPYV